MAYTDAVVLSQLDSDVAAVLEDLERSETACTPNESYCCVEHR